MVTGVTAPQKRKHTQKDKKIDIRLDCAYTSTSLVGLFFTLFNQTFDNLMASPLMEFSAAHLKRFCFDAELKGLRFDSSFDLVLRLDLLHDGERLVYMNSLEISLEERSRYAALFSFTFLSFTLHDVYYFLPPL